MLLGVLIAAFAGAPWLVLASASVLGRRRGAEALLAARRSAPTCAPAAASPPS